MNHDEIEEANKIGDDPPRPEYQDVMVLADGETHSSLAGCRIIRFRADVDPDEYENIIKGMAFHGEDPADGSASLVTIFS